MHDWLDAALASFSLPGETEGYLLGRGIKEARIRDLGLVVWDSRVIGADAPDRVFREGDGQKGRGHGRRGERLNGRLCTPIRSPSGRLIGVEARAWQGEKKVSQYLLPEAGWNPVLIGLTPETMRRVWAGADVWLGEGLFDMGAMEHVVPEKDVAFATLRARVSDTHAVFLKRHCTGWVNLVYDNDETGRNQTLGYTDPVTGKHRWGALEVLKRVGVRARDVRYSGGKDPGEVWGRRGTTGLRQAFGGAI